MKRINILIIFFISFNLYSVEKSTLIGRTYFYSDHFDTLEIEFTEDYFIYSEDYFYSDGIITNKYKYRINNETGISFIEFGENFEKKWLIPILMLSPFCMIVAIILNIYASNSFPKAEHIFWGGLAFLSFPVFLVIGGPLGEEIGWRGFALDQFQRKWDSITSSVILGAIWGLWHLPLFFMKESPHHMFVSYMPILVIFFFITKKSGFCQL